MGTLSFTATVSVDGFAADVNGDFQWTAPSDEVFAFHVERMAPVSTEVLGRNTYLLMRYWENEPDDAPWGELERQFAAGWREIDQVVVSSTLTSADLEGSRARLVPTLDLDALRQIVHDAPGEVEIFGPTTAAAAIRAGLVHDFRLFVVPRLVGAGLRALPSDVHLDLDLIEHRVFGKGMTFHHYRSRER